jgi:hypothetical protein
MKKALLSVFCFVFLALAASGAGWSPQQVTRSVSISFPAAPHTSSIPDQTNYLLETDSCSYFAQTRQYIYDGKVHDSITLAAFYDGMVKGILRAAKGTLVRKDSIKVAGLQAIELEYVKGDERSLPLTVCSRGLLLNGELLLYSFAVPSESYDRMRATREKFFASLSIKKDTVLMQYKPVDAAIGSSSALSADPAPSDTTRHVSPPVSFINSHAGAVVKTFGLLILFSAMVYFLATFSRRKG